MKRLGLKVDSKGRIHIPKDLREQLGIRNEVSVEINEGKVTIEPVERIFDRLAAGVRFNFKSVVRELPKLRDAAEKELLEQLDWFGDPLLLIETDVLLAALNPADPTNSDARRVFQQEPLSLSPFSSLELNLLSRAGKLEILDYEGFARDLSALLDASSIQTLSDRPEYHSEARRLESKFGLTFFDSLHGAVSKVRREPIISFDRAYDRLEKAGIRRISPDDLSGQSEK
jgi:AbrB family looped-hinge helix DNA binding protein